MSKEREYYRRVIKESKPIKLNKMRVFEYLEKFKNEKKENKRK